MFGIVNDKNLKRREFRTGQDLTRAILGAGGELAKARDVTLFITARLHPRPPRSIVRLFA